MMRKKLELQADRIEAVLASHDISARVTGGTNTPRWCRFVVSPIIKAQIPKIKGLSEELAAALGTPSCQVSRHGAAVAIKILNNGPVTVDTFLDAMAYYECLHTVALGISEDGRPLMANLCSDDGAHVLITGEGREGVLALMVKSLTMWNNPDTLRVASADGQLEILAQGVTDGREKQVPLAVALINGGIPGSPAALHTILELGPSVGLHVLMTASHVNDDLRALFPIQITGLGNGYAHCIAPGFQGTFQAPVSARITQ
jgi:hypothetical protein